VDWIPSSAFGDDRPGRVGLTFLPGKHGPSFRYPGVVYERDLVYDLQGLAKGGVHRLLLLVEDSELERWGDPAIVERARDSGVTIERHPIPDMHPPASVDDMDRLAAWIDAARLNGDVAVACMGGVGRTGTVAACMLVAAGWSPTDAIAEVRRVRHPTSVETAEQERFVKSYAESKRRTGDTIG
jgi:protein-tyrosine phosphatase